MKLSATVKEAVADAETDMSQKEDPEACPSPLQPGTRQDGDVEQPDIW
jgi:hypothetical protein